MVISTSNLVKIFTVRGKTYDHGGICDAKHKAVADTKSEGLMDGSPPVGSRDEFEVSPAKFSGMG